MGEKFNGLEPEVQTHIKKLVKTAGLENSEDSLELMAGGWLEKHQAFMEQTKQREMEETDNLDINDQRGALIMTWSGSLINIGPEINDFRNVEYFSIGLRNDVPESASEEESILNDNVIKGMPVEFEKGPIQKSSPVYAIAVVKEEMLPEEEAGLLDEVTLLIAEDFTSINKTTIQEN